MVDLPKSLTFEEARAAIDDILRRYALSVGPHDISEDGEPEMEPRQGVLLSEWTVALGWVEIEGAGSWVTNVSSAGLPCHHKLGLLQYAIEAIEDGE